MRAVLAISILGLSHSVAHAQPALTPPIEVTEPSLDFRIHRPAAPEYKNPNTAMMLSIGASVVGLGGVYLGSTMHGGDTPMMMLGGLVAVIGPSMGDWYVTGTPRLTPGFGIRIAGATIMGLGLARAIDTACMDNVCEAPLENRQSNFLIGIGAATIAAGMIYDFATVGRTAERHNASLHLSPQIVSTSHGTAPGFGVAGSF